MTELVHLHRGQDRLDVAPLVAAAVAGLVAQGLAGQDASIGLIPQRGHLGIDIGLDRPLTEMGAPMRAAGRVVHHVAAVRIGDPEVERQALDGRAQPRLGLGEPRLGPLALADVEVDADEAPDRAVGVANRSQDLFDVDGFALDLVAPLGPDDLSGQSPAIGVGPVRPQAGGASVSAGSRPV